LTKAPKAKAATSTLPATACPDWAARLQKRKMPISTHRLPMHTAQAKRISAIFGNLTMPDLDNTPQISDLSETTWWMDEVGRALFGGDTVREAFVMVPKKQSKTSSGSLLYLAAYLANTVPQLTFTVLAPTVSIAQFSFDQIVGAIISEPELMARTHIKRNEKRIEHLQTRAVLQVKSASLESLTGLKGSVFVDELHLWGAMRDGQKLRSQLRGALAVNKAARALYITTQSDDVPAGVFRNMLTYARHVRDGVITDPAFLPVLFEPWEGCDPWEDEKVWPMLLPSYPHIADRSFYTSMVAESNSSGQSAIVKDKSQYFNIEIGAGEGGNGWVVAQNYSKLVNNLVTLDRLIAVSERIAVGIDMGGAGDLTAIVVIGETRGGGWQVWTRAYLTDHGWTENVKNASRFEDFESQGDLVTVQPGEDAAHIVDLCVEIRASGKLAGIGIDPAAASDLADALEAAGFEMERDMHGIGQSAFRLAPAVRTVERRAEQRKLVFADQPMMAWTLGNVIVTQKGNAPCIDKQNALDKIDPVAALLDAAMILVTQKEPVFDPLAMVG
jgi:phage terminase large subunit-like protein